MPKRTLRGLPLGRFDAQLLHGDRRRGRWFLGAALEVPLGMRFTPEDELILPIRAVCCPFCEKWVPVDAMTMMETLWLHEYDCAAIALDYEMAA